MPLGGFPGVLVCFLTFWVAGVIPQGITSLSIDDVPLCGLQCILYNLPASGCELDDADCLCHSRDFSQGSSYCMLENCTMADSLVTAKVQANMCNLQESSKTTEVIMYTSIVYGVGTIFVILRCWAKIVSKRVSADDYLVAVCLLLTAISVGCVIQMTQIGFGNHLWMLEEGQLMENLRLFFIATAGYVVVLGLLKIALLLFYLQIFPSRGFRLTTYIIMGLIVASSGTIFFLTVFACNPVKAFWDRDIKAKCMDVNLLAYANSASAIVQDLIILILPFPWVFKLNMQRWRKIAVALMFSVGIFGTITTILRLRSLLSFRMSINPTWDYVPVTIWTELELGCIFVCLCLPSVRILLVRALPAGMLASLKSRTRSRLSKKSDKDEGHHSTGAGSHPKEQDNTAEEKTQKQRSGSTWLHLFKGSPDNWRHESGFRSGVNKSGSGTSKSRTMRESIKVWMAPWPRTTTASYSPSHSHPRSWSLVHDARNDCTGGPSKRDSDLELMSTSKHPAHSESRVSPEPPGSHSESEGCHDKRIYCKSCGSDGDVITALPQIGYLPDRSYSSEGLNLDRIRTGSMGSKGPAINVYHAV